MTEITASEISTIRETLRPSPNAYEIVELYESMIRIGRTGTEAFVTTAEIYGFEALVEALNAADDFASYNRVMARAEDTPLHDPTNSL